MNIYLEGQNLITAVFIQFYSLKTPVFILSLEIQDYHLLINVLVSLAVAIMILLLVVMLKSLRALKESTLGDNEKGKVWIKKNLYDFDAEQLKMLIKKINKADKNDKQIKIKN